MGNKPLTIGKTTVPPGRRRQIEIPVARLVTQTRMSLPVEVVNGAAAGPCVWLSAAIHGDELNGVEIVHRVLNRVRPRSLSGAIIAVPIVNVFGFIQRSRYLPDGRDLNRSFPGSPRGSLASRLAHLFVEQIVANATHGIDLHTAGGERTNLPQVRADLRDAETRRIAQMFAAPCMVQIDCPAGSLRAACAQRKKPMIVYEAGEPNRFNPDAIRIGIRGVLRVLNGLGMIRHAPKACPPLEVRQRYWLRARRSGILRLRAGLGKTVKAGQSLGVIHDAFGQRHTDLLAPIAGLIIGHTNHPLVNQGDAVVHLATDVVEHASSGGSRHVKL